MYCLTPFRVIPFILKRKFSRHNLSRPFLCQPAKARSRNLHGLLKQHCLSRCLAYLLGLPCATLPRQHVMRGF